MSFNTWRENDTSQDDRETFSLSPILFNKCNGHPLHPSIFFVCRSYSNNFHPYIVWDRYINEHLARFPIIGRTEEEHVVGSWFVETPNQPITLRNWWRVLDYYEWIPSSYQRTIRELEGIRCIDHHYTFHLHPVFSIFQTAFLISH